MNLESSNREKGMKGKILSLIQNPYFPILLLVLSVYVLIYYIQVVPGNDDDWFHSAINDMGVIPWLIYRYQTWSSRLSIDLATALINYNMPVWKLLNSTLVGLLVLGLSRFVIDQKDSVEKKRTIVIFLCGMMYLLYPFVFSSAIIWTTGSFNYLWPVTAFVYALYPFYRRTTAFQNRGMFAFLGVCFAGAFAAYMEQTLAILVVFGLFSIFFSVHQKKRLPWKIYVLYTVILANGAVALTTPGVAIRKVTELHWYPNFSAISTIQKLYEGINWTHTHVLICSSYIVVFLTAMLYVLHRKRGPLPKLLAGIPAVYCLLRVIPFQALFSRILNYRHGYENELGLDHPVKQVLDIGAELNKLLYSFYNYNEQSTQWYRFVPSVIGLFVLLLIAILLVTALRKKENGINCAVLFCGALASGYVLFLSPTIYASGSRIFFAGDILLLLILGTLLKEVLDTTGWLEKKSFYYARILYVLLVGVMYCSYLTNYSHNVLWL